MWILFAVLFLLGASGVIYSFIRSTYYETPKYNKAIIIAGICLLLSGAAGLIATNYRILVVLFFSVLSVVIVLISFEECEGAFMLFIIFSIVPACVFGIRTSAVQTNSYMSEYTLESETDLVSLADEVTVDVSGKASRRYVYVQSEAENAYTYRYETTSEIDGSNVYKKEVVTGNIEEKEVDDCNKPVLQTYVRYNMLEIKNFYTGKTKEAQGDADRLYVFVVPTGSIQKNIELK
ncbi:MAG: hypothetical protein MJ246_08295 [Clostridia bacterium]|nr:hypothetical protein [Clostridia bacterium]